MAHPGVGLTQTPMLARAIVRARLWVLALAALSCFFLLRGVGHVQQDDDVLAFLPRGHEDVVAFEEIGGRFGMLELVLVGLGADPGDFHDPARVDVVRALSQRVAEIDGVRLVLGYADLPHPVVTEDGLEVAPLLPESIREREAIAARIATSPDAVGNFVSADGAAVALLVYLRSETGGARVDLRRRVLPRLREIVEAGWAGEVHLTGAPVIEDEASLSSRADLERLSPVVVGVLTVASAVLLRSLTAALLNLAIAALGVGLVVGAHGLAGEPLTIVSSTLPVMLVALGGAFGVHLIAGYQRRSGTSPERAAAALGELALPVILSGATTALSFFALVIMPQVPMYRFGVAAGLGVLLLLVLALTVLPALLAILPRSVLRTRAEPGIGKGLRRPPAWALVTVGLLSLPLATRLRADADVSGVFDPDSAPRQAERFFARHFGGATFLQIEVEGPLQEPAVLRAMRELQEDVAAVDGVADVRSLLGPVAIVNQALGGRRGIPETPDRARRVATTLSGHPAMAQLASEDGRAALMHVKLAPSDGAGQERVVDAVRALVARGFASGRISVVPASAHTHERATAVAARLRLRLGRELPAEPLERDPLASPPPELLTEVRALRDRALEGDDSPVEGVPRVEIDAIDPAALLHARGPALASLLREALPTLAARDPEGIRFVAEHLGSWLDDLLVGARARARCAVVGLAADECESAQDLLSELDDPTWAVAGAVEGSERELEVRARITGQPVIGLALATSVSESLVRSTAISLAALTLFLALFKMAIAVVPAVWALAVTMGALALAGHPITVATSMVTCLTVGAGVDFAIHLLVWARTHRRDGAAAAAVLGPVALAGAGELAAAFLVLLASTMPPLRQFGAGLAVGLCVAALGAIWLVPALLDRHRPRKGTEPPSGADPGPP